MLAEQEAANLMKLTYTSSDTNGGPIPAVVPLISAASEATGANLKPGDGVDPGGLLHSQGTPGHEAVVADQVAAVANGQGESQNVDPNAVVNGGLRQPFDNPEQVSGSGSVPSPINNQPFWLKSKFKEPV